MLKKTLSLEEWLVQNPATAAVGETQEQAEARRLRDYNHLDSEARAKKWVQEASERYRGTAERRSSDEQKEAAAESTNKRKTRAERTLQDQEEQVAQQKKEGGSKCGACGGTGSTTEGDGDTYPYTVVTCSSCSGSGQQ